jgi:hypothetical protein
VRLFNLALRPCTHIVRKMYNKTFKRRLSHITYGGGWRNLGDKEKFIFKQLDNVKTFQENLTRLDPL